MVAGTVTSGYFVIVDIIRGELFANGRSYTVLEPVFVSVSPIAVVSEGVPRGLVSDLKSVIEVLSETLTNIIRYEYKDDL